MIYQLSISCDRQTRTTATGIYAEYAIGTLYIK